MPYLGRPVTNAGQFEIIDDISSDFDGSETSFSLKVGNTDIQPDVANVTITLGGVYQVPASAYSITGSTINFSEAPESNTAFHGVLAGQSQFIESDFITNTMIKSTANISGSKINTDFSGKTVKAAIFDGMVSSSAQIADNISGSFSQVHLSSKISGIVSASSIASSAQGQVALTTNGVAATAVDLGLQSGDSPTFAGGTITGDFSVGGTITAQEVHTEFESASILFTSGSTQFGNSSDDVHEFKGNLISGSSTSTASLAMISLADKIEHIGDTNNTIEFGTDEIKLRTGGGSRLIARDSNVELYNDLVVAGAATFNEDSGDKDFRVESNGNTHMLFVDAGNNRVGIGTSSPAQILDVQGGRTHLKSSDEYNLRLYASNGDSGKFIGTPAGDKLSIYSDVGNPEVTVDASGNVGIGTNHPSGALHINGANPTVFITNSTQDGASTLLRITEKKEVDGNAGGYLLYNGSSNIFQIGTNISSTDTPSITLLRDGSGRVGIGTTNPTGKLQIRDTTTGTVGETLTLDTDQTLGGRGTMIRFTGNNRGFVGAEIQGRIDEDNTEKMSLLFVTNDGSATNEIVRITANKQVGIGTLAPTAKLHIHNPGNGSGGVPSGGDEDTLIVSSSIRHFTAQIDNGYSSYDSTVMALRVPNRAGTQSYNFMVNNSNDGEEIKHRGDGSIQARNTTLQGFDYAEFFEVALTEHTASGIPAGVTVALTGSKVIPASQSSEEPIGIVRPRNTSAIIGNSPWNHWHAKYKTTDYGAPILDEDSHRVVNPSYVSQSYSPREDRNEWVIVGLLGQIPVTDGQPTGSSWRKMHNISPTASMWFVK